MRRSCANSNDLRYYLLGWLFDYREDDDLPLRPISTRELTNGAWQALWQWAAINPQPPYDPSEEFQTQIALMNQVVVAILEADLGELFALDDDLQFTKYAAKLGGAKIKELKDEEKDH